MTGLFLLILALCGRVSAITPDIQLLMQAKDSEIKGTTIFDQRKLYAQLGMSSRVDLRSIFSSN